MSGLDQQLIDKLRERQKLVLPPRRPMSAYFLYLGDIREDLFASNPNTSVADISRLAGAKWRNVDPKTRSTYQKKAEEIKAKYEIQKAQYEEKYGPIKRPRKAKRAKRKFGDNKKKSEK